MGNKNVSERFPQPLKIKYPTVDNFLVDYTENIRRGGSFVRTEKPMIPGTRLSLELEVAGVPVFINLRGRVAWVNDPEGEWSRHDLPPGMGVLFIFPDEPSRLLLDNLVDRLEKAPYSHAKTINPEYLRELLIRLRPDIQKFIRERSDVNLSVGPFVKNILGEDTGHSTEDDLS